MDQRNNREGHGKGKPHLADLMASLSTEDIEELIVAAEKRRMDQRDDIEKVDGPRVRRVKLRVNPEPVSETPGPAVTVPQGRPFIPDPKYTTPEALRQAEEWRQAEAAKREAAEFVPTANQKKKGSRKAAGPPVKKVIRLMNGRIPWDAMEALRRTPVVGLDWGSFLALAPSVKGQLGRGLILEKTRGPGQGEVAKLEVQKLRQRRDQQNVVEVSSIQASPCQTEDMGFLYGDAIPEPSGPITNFYTEGKVTNQVQGILKTFRIPKVLIDGGAVINLMSEAVVL